MPAALSDDGKKILRLMLDRPVITGGEVSILTGLESKELRELHDAGIISSNTASSDVNDILKSYLNLNPSARGYAQFAAT